MQNTTILPTQDTSATYTAGLMPLPMAIRGECYTVASVRGKDDTKTFLTGLGFAPGAMVSVVCQMGGNLIIRVKGSRIALSKNMAQRVQVS